MLALTSFYNEGAVRMWSSGTGFAGVSGAGAYLVLHKIIGMSPRSTLYATAAVPLLYLFAFFVLLRPDGLRQHRSADGASDEEGESEESATVSLARTGDTGGAEGDGDVLDEASGAHLRRPSALEDRRSVMHRMTFSERVRRIGPLLPYMTPLIVVYFAEYTINTGVNPTLSFRDMRDSTFYVAASFVYQIGVFVSRSSRSWLPLRRLWPLPVMQCALLAFFILQSLTALVPSAYAMLALVFIEGLLGGATCEAAPAHRGVFALTPA